MLVGESGNSGGRRLNSRQKSRSGWITVLLLSSSRRSPARSLPSPSSSSTAAAVLSSLARLAATSHCQTSVPSSTSRSHAVSACRASLSGFISVSLFVALVALIRSSAAVMWKQKPLARGTSQASSSDTMTASQGSSTAVAHDASATAPAPPRAASAAAAVPPACASAAGRESAADIVGLQTTFTSESGRAEASAPLASLNAAPSLLNLLAGRSDSPAFRMQPYSAATAGSVSSGSGSGGGTSRGSLCWLQPPRSETTASLHAAIQSGVGVRPPSIPSSGPQRELTATHFVGSDLSGKQATLPRPASSVLSMSTAMPGAHRANPLQLDASSTSRPTPSGVGLARPSRQAVTAAVDSTVPRITDNSAALAVSSTAATLLSPLTPRTQEPRCTPSFSGPVARQLSVGSTDARAAAGLASGQILPQPFIPAAAPAHSQHTDFSVGLPTPAQAAAADNQHGRSAVSASAQLTSTHRSTPSTAQRSHDLASAPSHTASSIQRPSSKPATPSASQLVSFETAGAAIGAAVAADVRDHKDSAVDRMGSPYQSEEMDEHERAAREAEIAQRSKQLQAEIAAEDARFDALIQQHIEASNEQWHRLHSAYNEQMNGIAPMGGSSWRELADHSMQWLSELEQREKEELELETEDKASTAVADEQDALITQLYCLDAIAFIRDKTARQAIQQLEQGEMDEELAAQLRQEAVEPVLRLASVGRERIKGLRMRALEDAEKRRHVYDEMLQAARQMREEQYGRSGA